MTKLNDVVKEHFYETEKKEKEKKPRICKEWLQIEHCRECLFETLCRLNWGLDK